MRQYVFGWELADLLTLPYAGSAGARCSTPRMDTPHVALLESTAGHKAVRDCIYKFACGADPATEWEPQDLVPSRPRARPADVLTPAVFRGCVAALDVGIVAPPWR